jgi:Flp pilus assembly pilin Flp
MLLAAFGVSSYGQAMVEYGLGVGRGSLAGAAAGKKMGNATSSVLNKAAGAVEKSATAAQAAPAAKPGQPAEKTQVAAASPSAPQAPSAPPAVDASAIQPGIERQELVAKFGKPSMKLTQNQGSDIVEKYWYKAAGRETVTVTLRNGKVAEVTPPAAVQ